MGRQAFYGKPEKALAAQNLERMGMTAFRRRCYRELSGDQQQRVLLARALCATRKLLLMDEPVSGLDPKVTAEMYDLIERLNRDGLTVIMISHDIQAASRYASHILHLAGADVFFGTTGQYKNSVLGRRFDIAEGGAGA